MNVPAICRLLPLPAVLATLGACSLSHPKPTLKLVIEAADNTNFGGPLYMVVRKTNREGFLAEDYDSLAGSMFGKEDPAILRREVIWPKDLRELKVEKQKEEDVVGVYFFYSTPGQSWRFAVLDPKVKGMRVRLGANEIKSVEPTP